MRKYSREPGEQVIEGFNSDAKIGLTQNQVVSLQKAHGPNKLDEEQKDHILVRYIGQFKDPLILLLLGSAGLSIIVGQYEDALSIAVAVLIVGTVAFYQESKSEESLEALNTLVPPRCNVMRASEVKNILAEELVPGDLVLLLAGDRVPADCRIIHCSHLAVDESTLTGETDPREKISGPLPDLKEDCDLAAIANVVYMGTLVCSGHATVVVIGTAADTEFGKAFEEMKDIENRRSPLQTKMDELGQKLSIFSMGIIVCIGVIGMLQGKSFLAMFNIGVSLAVAAIPEGLPICVTVTLALGVMRMAKKNAIVKKLPAVETLGCANYVCADKTGTLTENKMTVISFFCPAMDDVETLESNKIEKTLSVNGNSSSKRDDGLSGMCDSSSDGNAIKLVEIKLNGSMVSAESIICVKTLFEAACLCNNATLTGATITGQPTEGALLLAARSMGISDPRAHSHRVNEINFSSDTKFMEVSYQHEGETSNGVASKYSSNTASASGSSNPSVVRYLKGALEVILPQCVTYLDNRGELILLSAAVKERVLQHSVDMSSDGLRVLGVAFGTQQNQLTLAGIVGLMDPLREGVVDGVLRIQNSGAKVIMITGDAETTALAIARKAGVHNPLQTHGRVLSGGEIESLVQEGEHALSSVIEDVTVCYRTSPRHKLYLVRALQSRGHVVTMTGDGVNDAPALKAADIGVAVGSGTDVAKEAADMIIVDDNFATIVSAIEEGKSIFYNIKNFLTFQLSTSVAALSLVALNNLLGRPNPLNPMQILWINIIMDGPLAQSLGVETVDSAVMQRPPRRRSEDIITRPLLMRVISSGILILLGTWYVFTHEMEDGAISARDLTMTFTTFVMFDLFNAFSCRHNSRCVSELSITSNRAYLLAMTFTLLGQGMVIYFPPLQQVFRTEALLLEDVIFVVLLASSMLVLDTIRKRFFASTFTEVIRSKRGRSSSKDTLALNV